jgi:quercetin dioxygenase-like cupin family protein
MKSGKIWGENNLILSKNNVAIHRLFIKKDYRCSKHVHQSKYNTFYVESGKIKLQEWKNDYNLVDETVLVSGEIATIPPKTYHRFIGLEDSIVYEIYYVELDNNDIIREDTGAYNEKT